MRIAMHQPNFVPWLPFFTKIASVDLFIIVYNCQTNRIGYQNRFKHHDRWYTMGIEHGNLHGTIAETNYANPEADWAKIKRRLPQYKKFFDDLDGCIGRSMFETNMAIIRILLEKLKITTPIVFDEPGNTLSTERLLALCQKHGCTHYVSGPTGREYLDVSRFDAAGIPVEFTDNSQLDRRHVFEL
jgi:hypothetical protein